MNDKPPMNEDLELFREAMGDVEPLSQDKTDPYKTRRRPEPLNLPVGDEDQEDLADLNIETGEFLEFMRPGIQHRVFSDLQRGVIEAEASLDLHGLRVQDARRAFARFIDHSLKAQRRCVRIIHGKGKNSEGQQPVLKQKTNQWLRQMDAVLAFSTAPRWDGGTGATYVLLSRKWGHSE